MKKNVKGRLKINVFNTHPTFRPDKRKIARIVKNVLKGESRENAEVNIIFINDGDMIALNKKFLNRNYSTDVISFPLSEDYQSLLEGEVYINVDQGRRQAREFNVRVMNEIFRLVIHGILHLVGYDDRTKHKRARMMQKETYYYNYFVK